MGTEGAILVEGENGRKRKRDWLNPSKWLAGYTRWAYKRPIRIFLLVCAILILCTIGAVASNAWDLSDEGDEWTLKKNRHAKQDKAIQEAEDLLGSFIKQSNRSEDNFFLKLGFIYKGTGDPQNMFTEENLAIMKEVENTMLQNAKFVNFCELNYTDVDNPICINPQSPLPFFFQFNASNQSQGYGEPIRTVAEGLAIMSEDLFTNGFFFTGEFTESGNTTSKYTQSRYSFGLPVPGYNNSNEEDEDQIEYVYDNFLKEVENDLFEVLGMEAKNFFRTEHCDSGKLRGVEVVFGAFALQNEEFERVVWKDFTWAFLSLLSVWLYMMFHLGSFFLSCVGAFEVFMAFPTGLFFYRTIFGVDYFAQLHILIIFILLGLGADDVFVFTDAFKQSEAMPGVGKSLPERLQYTAHRASKAVFVTSFTTAAAFFATATSGLMPMRAFGIFAGICIVLLFLINVLLMPPALVLWAGYTPWCVRRCCCCCPPVCRFLHRCLPCCVCCHVVDDEGFDLSSGAAFKEVAANADNLEGGKLTVQTAHPEDQVYERCTSALTAEAVSKMRPLERFFNGKYFNFLKVARWPLIIAGAVLFGVAMYYITTFSPPEETEEWWPDYHNFNKYQDLTDRGGPFISEDDDTFATVKLVWGLRGMDLTGYNVWDPDDWGVVEYDTEFRLSSPAEQSHLLGACGKAREALCTASACDADENGDKFLVRFDRSKPDSFERCWIEDMDEYVRSNTSLGYPDGLPVNETDFLPVLKLFMDTEVFLLKYQGHVGLFGGDDLKYVQLELTSTYRPPTAHQKTEPVLNAWEDFIVGLNEEAAANGADGVSAGYQTGGYSWVWIFSQKALIDNAVQGIFIVFAIAFVVLNFATGNVVISIIAIFTVAGIVTSVMGLAVKGIQDWDFGVAESIVSVILVGFSMDYSLHLADSYIESERSTRLDRTQDSLTRLGISVTAGAITTLTSGLFLWGAILTFFTKFAFMITSTIITSYLWSMLFFPSMAMTFGPEGSFGDWSTLIAAMRGWCGRGGEGK